MLSLCYENKHGRRLVVIQAETFQGFLGKTPARQNLGLVVAMPCLGLVGKGLFVVLYPADVFAAIRVYASFVYHVLKAAGRRDAATSQRPFANDFRDGGSRRLYHTVQPTSRMIFDGWSSFAPKSTSAANLLLPALRSMNLR